jgi:hypothetical protein
MTQDANPSLVDITPDESTRDEGISKPIRNLLLSPYIPDEFRESVLKWTHASKSPFSDSWYSKPGKTWDHTPEGCLRLSDHWNFIARGEIHCVTETPILLPVGKDGKRPWAIGRREGDRYRILAELPATGDKTARTKADAVAKTAIPERLAGVSSLGFRLPPLTAGAIRRLRKAEAKARAEAVAKEDAARRKREREEKKRRASVAGSVRANAAMFGVAFPAIRTSEKERETLALLG